MPIRMLLNLLLTACDKFLKYDCISAYAAPSVAINQVPINSVIPRPVVGGQVNGDDIDRIFEIVDGADTNIYILTIQQILNDMADQPDPYTKAMAVSQALAVLGELATGVPGDACAAAAVVDASANGHGDSPAVRAYLNRLAANIDLIAQLAVNPDRLRYSTGARGNCVGAGRSYQFEAIFNVILDRANPYNIGLVNEEYCAAKRLYTAFNSRSNNVGAAVAAAGVPGVVEAVLKALGPVTNFLRIAGSGGNASAAAAVAKNAMLSY